MAFSVRVMAHISQAIDVLWLPKRYVTEWHSQARLINAGCSLANIFSPYLCRSSVHYQPSIEGLNTTVIPAIKVGRKIVKIPDDLSAVISKCCTGETWSISLLGVGRPSLFLPKGTSTLGSKDTSYTGTRLVTLYYSMINRCSGI